ncbi:NAD(P)H-dependent oxidoreductase [Epilithonimonas xixisoli]|uniref:Modulator of drug activity B n=1 Tax=Epilithonimonas xixisoli TaxID=1476462 RepID=A0A4R8I4L7_9FLAO|nr:NAD(P)H-dependent oxidoreductase [Epilithonimonas xixisoli]TDX83223.1 modulator of drug activity B [Epilithonimonas xixisoli]
MKAKNSLLSFLIFLSFGINLNAQNSSSKDKSTQKTVLLINTHVTYPGWSEGKLNTSFYNVAKEFFISKNYKVLETKVEDGYNADDEVEKHLQADIVILQTPINWENTPWIYKKYVDEVFNSALKSKKFLSGDGRTAEEGSKQYGMGGKMIGKKFMISATWNAPEESFNNPKNPLWKGKTADDALFNIAANYLFTGFEVVPGHYCYDVYHNKHIKQDLENYPAYLQKVFNIQ